MAVTGVTPRSLPALGVNLMTLRTFLPGDLIIFFLYFLWSTIVFLFRIYLNLTSQFSTFYALSITGMNTGQSPHPKNHLSNCLLTVNLWLRNNCQNYFTFTPLLHPTANKTVMLVALTLQSLFPYAEKIHFVPATYQQCFQWEGRLLVVFKPKGV